MGACGPIRLSIVVSDFGGLFHALLNRYDDGDEYKGQWNGEGKRHGLGVVGPPFLRPLFSFPLQPCHVALHPLKLYPLSPFSVC